MDNSQQNYQNDGLGEEASQISEGVTSIDDTIDDVEFESYTGDDFQAKNISEADKISKLKVKLAESNKQKQEYLDGWQRLKADYVNLKKRSEDEKIDLSKFAKESFVGDLIPVIESFDMAFSNKEAWERVDPTWRIGVEYIHKQFIETLSSYGLKEVNPLGEAFDPNEHTAIENVSTDDQTNDHKVAEVVQKGYKVQDRLIKSPKVKVFVYNRDSK